MAEYLLLIRFNLRKSKGQTAAVTVLILLAAVMLNLWLMLSTDYKSNFDRCHDALNAEHVIFAIADNRDEVRDFLSDTVESDKRTAQYQIDDVMMMTGSIPYNDGETNTNFIFLEKETALTRPVGKVEITQDSSHTSGVYLPMLYKTGDINVGRPVQISIGGKEMEFTVCGFFNSAMAGSHNCSLCELILTEDAYQKLARAGYAPASALCSVRLTDKNESESYEAMLNSTISARYPDTFTSSNSYALVTSSRYISQMICSAIISAMAFFVLLIALIIIASNIGNYIQENMKHFGALKAIGYTSRQLIASFILQFTGIAFLTSVIGVGISYLLFPAVNTMMIEQTGIPYAVHFLPLPFLVTLLILCTAAALSVWLASRKIRTIEPITALRQGIKTHSFRSNPAPLEKTKAPLSLALALKTTASGMKQNVTVCVTMLVLSLIVVFSGLMLENMIIDSTPFLDLVVGEAADSCINIDAEKEDAFLREMKEDDRVEKVYLYHSESVRHEGNVELMVTICDDFAKVNNKNVCFEGRFPKYDNEIVIAKKYTKEQGLKIGDEITLTANGKEASYLITGHTQITNYLGKDCLLTREGYERLGDLQNLSFYLNLKKHTDIGSFNEAAAAQFGANLTVNVDTVITGSAAVYISLMTVIVIAILVLSMVIIAFVLYLLVRNLLSMKKRDYGILKSLGFTTGQLVIQTALSFMPVMIVSMAAGLVISGFIINPLVSVFLSGIGVVKCTFAVPVGFTIAAGAGLVLFAFLSACLMALRIRRITPQELLASE